MNEAVILALVAIVGAVITALFKLLGENTTALNSLVGETTKGNLEAKERNGHLGEHSIKIAKLVLSQNNDTSDIKKSNAKIADILSKSALIAAEDRDTLLSPEQHIEKQFVGEQVIGDKK